MLNHDHERRHHGIQEVEAAGRRSARTGEACDGDPVPRIACGSGTDRGGVPGRLRGATEATFADHSVPLQSAKSKGKKAAVKRSTAKNVREVPQAAPSVAKPNADSVGLQKRLATAKKKLDEAKAAGKPTKAVEDRIYEIEDELRLAGQKQ